MNIVEKFSQFLTHIEYPKEKCSWHISGILPKFSNQILKFDVRGMTPQPNGQLGKPGSRKSKADKIVFETKNEWFIFDTDELHQYIKEHKIKVIPLEEMIQNLYFVWRIKNRDYL